MVTGDFYRRPFIEEYFMVLHEMFYIGLYETNFGRVVEFVI